MNIKSSIKQYGIYNSFKRLVKMILRKLGFHYESFWYLVNKLDIEEVKQKMQKNSYEDVKELNIIDFKKGDPEIFNKNKLDLIQNRFQSKNYWSYGVVENSKLVYSCWITSQQVSYPDKFKKSVPLKENEGFMVDAYCHPAHRGKGLHSKMNLFRLLQLHKLDKEKIIVLVLSENIPALKSQIKSGFKKEKKIVFLKIFSKQFYFEKKCR